MKNLKWLPFFGAVSCLTLCLTVLVVVGVDSMADEVPQPRLSITITNGTNYIKVTNAVSFANYELWRRPSFSSDDPWVLHMMGAQGQSNFAAAMGVFNQGYFFVGVGSDWDNDSVTNAMDADPSNPSIGILSITIDAPVNGTIFN